MSRDDRAFVRSVAAKNRLHTERTAIKYALGDEKNEHYLLPCASFGVVFIFEVSDMNMTGLDERVTPPLECIPRQKLSPLLFFLPHVKVSINGVESKKESCDTLALLYTGDTVIVSRTEKERAFKFSCRFFGVRGDSGRVRPVKFLRQKVPIPTV